MKSTSAIAESVIGKNSNDYDSGLSGLIANSNFFYCRDKEQSQVYQLALKVSLAKMPMALTLSVSAMVSYAA
jgi:hypothetical protein